MMRWLALDFATTHEAADLLVDYLSGLGAEGVEVQDAQKSGRYCLLEQPPLRRFGFSG